MACLTLGSEQEITNSGVWVNLHQVQCTQLCVKPSYRMCVTTVKQLGVIKANACRWVNHCYCVYDVPQNFAYLAIRIFSLK